MLLHLLWQIIYHILHFAFSHVSSAYIVNCYRRKIISLKSGIFLTAQLSTTLLLILITILTSKSSLVSFLSSMSSSNKFSGRWLWRNGGADCDGVEALIVTEWRHADGDRVEALMVTFRRSWWICVATSVWSVVFGAQQVMSWQLTKQYSLNSCVVVPASL